METPATAEFGSVILAGGQSRRMGRNKALLRLDPAGPTLVEGVVAAVAARGPIVLVTNTPEEYAFLGLPMVADAPEHAGAGPLAGLYSGLRASTAAYNLTLACDMPRLQPALLDVMAALPRDYDALVPRWTAPDGTEQIETLHAIYSKACLPAIAACLAANRRRMIAFFRDVRVRYLDEPDLRAVDPDLSSFRNLNTPDEFAALGG
jgi:molybdenum cofactor guanylyltransferase